MPSSEDMPVPRPEPSKQEINWSDMRQHPAVTFPVHPVAGVSKGGSRFTKKSSLQVDPYNYD